MLGLLIVLLIDRKLRSKKLWRKWRIFLFLMKWWWFLIGFMIKLIKRRGWEGFWGIWISITIRCLIRVRYYSELSLGRVCFSRMFSCVGIAERFWRRKMRSFKEMIIKSRMMNSCWRVSWKSIKVFWIMSKEKALSFSNDF